MYFPVEMEEPFMRPGVRHVTMTAAHMRNEKFSRGNWAVEPGNTKLVSWRERCRRYGLCFVSQFATVFNVSKIWFRTT